MAATATVVTTCDLCGHGDAYTGPETFTRRDGFDFCRWCMTTGVSRIESGGHVVTLAGGSWSCDCGALYGSVVLTLRMHGVSLTVMGAVPDLAAATASVHVNTPRWPRTY